MRGWRPANPECPWKENPMKHVQPITALPSLAQGSTSPIEGAILLLISIFFQDWDNFTTVLQNLSKFYSKTPN
jgi:hypothetical protein